MRLSDLLKTVSAVAIALAGMPALSAAAQDDLGLDVVVVTSQKRAENIQDVPISVTAISETELRNRSAESLRDLQDAVPNLSIYSQTDFNPNFIIRGVSSGARNVGFESSLGVYVDGVYMGRTSGFNQQLDDIERVEVLRGPQGTLFGKNSVSGALNIVTRRPGDDFEGSVFAEYGNFDHVHVGGYMSGPLVEGILAAKLSGYVRQRDGFVENINPDGPETVNNEDTWGVRGELRYTPVPALDIALRGDYTAADRRVLNGEVEAILSNPVGLPLVGAVPGPRTVSIDGKNKEDRTLSGTSLTAEYTFDSGYELTSITAMRNIEYGLPDADLDGEPASYLATDYIDEISQFTQEIRLASPQDQRWRYIAGIYYLDQDSDSSRSLVLGSDMRSTLGALGVPPALLNDLTYFGTVETQSFALFGNLSVDITDRLELEGGLRYNKESKDLVFGQDGIDVLGLPTIAPFSDEIEEEDLSPTIGLNFSPTDHTLLYARYARGFKSGGWNADILSSPDPEDIIFDAESIDSYEVGLKTDFFNRRARLNVALFHMSYEDIQVSRFNSVTSSFETANAAEARSQGFEVEFSARPAEGLDLSAAVGYADAEYKSYPDAAPGVDLSGTRLDAPDLTLSAAAQYTRPISANLEATGRLDYSYRSDTPGDGLDPTSALDSIKTLNGRIGVTSQNGVSLFFWARNITDEDYVIAAYDGGNLASTIGVEQRFATYGEPRTYGVMLSFDF